MTSPQAAPSRRFRIDCRLDYELIGDTDFIFQIHASHHGGQRVIEEWLDVSPAAATWRIAVDPVTHQRRVRIHAGHGALAVQYRALVDVPPLVEPAPLSADTGVRDLPDDVLPYLLPTRYCESDLLAHAAWKAFGGVPAGEPRVRAIIDWVHEHVEFMPGTSVSATTARDVFVRRAGVCRDFAHLSIALARGLNIPARLVAGYSPFYDNEPPDFHAVLEAFVGGRWVLFDATRMTPLQDMVRIADGYDAKDVAFSTIFGGARMVRMWPMIEAA